jgi:hypothetical protein
MHRKANLKWRVLELAKKTSWGNENRDYSADENGHPLTQRDFAKILDVDFQRVSEAVEDLVEEGFLTRKGRILFVVDDPAAVWAAREETAKSNPPRPGKNGEEKVKFLKFWQNRDPEQFQQYQKLGAEIEEKFRQQRELKDAAWAAYQEEAQAESGTGWTNAEEDPERGGQNVRNGVDETSGTEGIQDEPILIGLPITSYKLASSSKREGRQDPGELVRLAVAQSGFGDLPGNHDRAVRNAAGRFASVPPALRAAVFQRFEADCKQIAARRENKPKSWGVIVTLMEDAIEACKRSVGKKPNQKAEAVPEISVQEQIDTLELLIADSPNHPQVEDWRKELAQLRKQLGTKTQKAGAQ